MTDAPVSDDELVACLDGMLRPARRAAIDGMLAAADALETRT